MAVPLSWVRLSSTPITALMQSSTALPTLLKLQWGSTAPDDDTELLFNALLYRWIISSQCHKALKKSKERQTDETKRKQRETRSI